jgi:hypothetical protein
MVGMKQHVFTDEVYWAIVSLKDNGNYRSVDEAVRPLLGLPAGQKNPRKKGFEVEENGSESEFKNCSWYRTQSNSTATQYTGENRIKAGDA